jgi:dipeptidyl aminopeptidase/acylaminoacyl peptidase
MTRRSKIFIITVLIITIGLFGFNYYGPRAIIQINSKIYGLMRPTDNKSIPRPDDFDINYEKITIRTSDNLILRGYLIRADSAKQKGTIILTHGIRAYKEHFLPLSKILSDSGYNSILMDLRAHGESDGKYCTFGYLEKQDLIILIDSLYQIVNLSKNIGIWGQSMGGAVAILTLASDKRLKFGIIESTFSDFRIIVHDYIKHFVGFDVPFLSNYLVFRAERIAHFDAEQVVPSNSATHITQPILMVHGNEDDRINIKYGLINFRNLASSNKQFLEYPANHLNVWSVGGEEYFKKVISFIDNQCKN